MKLLNELMQLNEMRESSNLKLLSIANNLIRELGSINDTSEEKLNAGEDETPAFSKKGQLSQHFRREHQDLMYAAKDIAKTTNSSALRYMSKLPTTAYKSDSKKSSTKNSQTMMDSLHLLRDGLRDIGELELHHSLNAELERFDDLKSRAAVKSRAKSKDAGLEKQNSQLRVTRGTQSTQAEELANTVIMTLPKHMQHEARGIIARSANKLADLESFINNYT